MSLTPWPVPPQEEILSCTPIISFSCSYVTKAMAMEGTTFT